jgi:hypothetical protein
MIRGIGIDPAHRRLRVYVHVYRNLADLNAAFRRNAKGPVRIRCGAFSTRLRTRKGQGIDRATSFVSLSFSRTRLTIEQLTHEALHATLAFASEVGWRTLSTDYQQTNAYHKGKLKAGDSREEHLAFFIGKLTKCVWNHWQHEGWVR